MNTQTNSMTSSKLVRLMSLLIGCALIVISAHAAQEKKSETGTPAPESSQKQFASPKEAVDALAQAASHF